MTEEELKSLTCPWCFQSGLWSRARGKGFKLVCSERCGYEATLSEEEIRYQFGLEE